MAGTLKERKRCKEFIDWLLAQRRGQVSVNDVANRDDVTEMHVPENCKGWVTGNRGSELRRVEQETGTYMFMALDRHGDERLLIFSADPGTKAGSMRGTRRSAASTTPRLSCRRRPAARAAAERAGATG